MNRDRPACNVSAASRPLAWLPGVCLSLAFGPASAAIFFMDVDPDPRTVDGSSPLSVNGFMRVDGGTQLQSGYAFVGRNIEDGSPAVVTVTGLGTAWDVVNIDPLWEFPITLSVGGASSGLLEVLGGASVSVEGGAFFGDSTLSGVGTLLVSGQASRFSADHVDVSGPDSQLTVTNGGSLLSASGVIGEKALVSVTGTGANWVISNQGNSGFLGGPWLSVGSFASSQLSQSAELDVLQGGTVSVAEFVFLHPGTQLVLDGNGSLLEAQALLFANPNYLEPALLRVGAGSELRLTDGISDFGSTGPNAIGPIEMRGGLISVSDPTASAGRSIYVTNSLDVNGHGRLLATLNLHNGISVHAHGGTLELGDPDAYTGFRTDGPIRVAADGTLVLQSKFNFARLGDLTTLEGGTLAATSGLTLDAGRALVGHGTVAARLSALQGSAIEALGTLSLGDANAFDGFFSNGLLAVNEHAVTLLDRNAAVLGSLTTVGSAEGPGTLNAPKGLLLDFGKTLSGHGEVNADILNNGLIHGSGPQRLDYLALNGTVRGVGEFGGTILFGGTVSPGLSPTQTIAENLIFGPNSVLEMELAGPAPGTGYDQILASGTVLADGKLSVVLLDGFTPQLGNVFDLVVAQELLGSFALTEFPNLSPDLRWDLQYLLGGGGGDALRLSVTAVPLPPAAWLFLTALGVLAARARRARPADRDDALTTREAIAAAA